MDGALRTSTTKKRMLFLEEISHSGADNPGFNSESGLNLSTIQDKIAPMEQPHTTPPRSRTGSTVGLLKRQSSINFKKTASAVGIASGVLNNHRSIHTDDELRSIEDCLLYDVMRPLFLAMKCFGIFFIRPQGEALFQRKRKGGILSTWTTLQVYCIIICMVLAINMLRSLSSFRGQDSFGNILFFKLYWSIMWYECASRALLNVRMCWLKKANLQDLFLTIERICYSDGIIPYEESMRKTLKVYLFSSFFLVFCYVIVAACGFFIHTEMSVIFDMVLLPFSASAPGIIAWEIIVLLILFLGRSISSLTLIFLNMVSFILYKEFEYLCRTLTMKIRDDGQFMDDLEKFRIMHQNRCKLVEQMDQLFKYYMANTFMTNIPLMCILFYSIINSADQYLSSRILGIFYLGSSIFQMVSVSVPATRICTQVIFWYLRRLGSVSLGGM